MEKKQTIKIVFDGREVEAEAGGTILEAARQNKIHIPTLCYHPAVSNWGGCRLCVVEVDRAPKLVASCVMPIRPGMEIVTSNEKILESRRTVLEYLFSERNHNCMFCPQSGECELQKLGYDMQMDHVSVPFSYNAFPSDVTSDAMVFDHNRCVLCGRCVRACSELAGSYVLNFQNRGPRSLIGMDLNEQRGDSTCLECGLCMQLCPTGAIASRYRSHYNVKGHPRNKRTAESVCTRCGLLCPVVYSVADNCLVKVESVLSGGSGRPDKGQLCYKGRFEIFKEGKRLMRPMVRGQDGRWKEESWEKALRITSERLKGLKENGGKSLVGMASSHLCNEELILFKDLMENLGAGYVDTLDGRHYRSILKGLEKAGKGLQETSWKNIAESDFILLVGGDPFDFQPLLSSLIRRSVLEKGLKVAVTGKSGRNLPVEPLEIGVMPGKEEKFMEALLVSLMKRGKGTPKARKAKTAAPSGEAQVTRILEAAGIAENEKEQFENIVKAFGDAKNPLVIAGPSLTVESNGTRLAAQISMLKGHSPGERLRLLLLKTCGNSAGAWKMRIPSSKESGRNAGWKGGMLLLGGEREPQELPPFLHELEFLAVVTPYLHDTLAQYAHVLLPSPSWAEREGTFTSLDGQETAYAKRILDLPEGVRDAWRTLIDLGKGTGSLLKMKKWDQLRTKAREMDGW